MIYVSLEECYMDYTRLPCGIIAAKDKDLVRPSERWHIFRIGKAIEIISLGHSLQSGPNAVTKV